MIIVKSQVKEIIKELGINNLSEDFVDRLNKQVIETIEKSCQRAKENGRKTIMGKDV